MVGVGGSECSQGWSLQHLGFPFGQVSVVAVEERGECFVVLYFFLFFVYSQGSESLTIWGVV